MRVNALQNPDGPLPHNRVRIDRQGFDHCQYIARARITRQAKCEGIVQQAQLIRGGQRRHVADQGGNAAIGIQHPAVGGLANIHQ